MDFGIATGLLGHGVQLGQARDDVPAVVDRHPAVAELDDVANVVGPAAPPYSTGGCGCCTGLGHDQLGENCTNSPS